MGVRLATRQRSAERRRSDGIKLPAASPRSRPPADRFQKSIGNSATMRVLSANHIQPKLSSSNPEDNYERQVPSIVHQVLQSTGKSLDANTRAFMEPRFNYDFSGVRVHTDNRAAASARAVNALAYTVGRNIVFSSGQYDPGSTQGQRLVAHELTHVVQQRAAGGELTGLLQRSAIFTGRILDEGSCADLVAGSKWICCDPENGAERKGKKKDVEGNDCPSEKFAPIFTCDNNCTKALAKGCDDNDNWMALPKTRFATGKCRQDLVICANESFTHAYVRDRSEREAWEVSKAIPAALGLNPDFNASVYPDENDSDFKKDKRCRKPPPPPTKEGTEKKGK